MLISNKNSDYFRTNKVFVYFPFFSKETKAKAKNQTNLFARLSPRRFRLIRRRFTVISRLTPMYPIFNREKDTQKQCSEPALKEKRNAT